MGPIASPKLKYTIAAICIPERWHRQYHDMIPVSPIYKLKTLLSLELSLSKVDSLDQKLRQPRQLRDEAPELYG